MPSSEATRARTKTAQRGGYTLVAAQGSAGYVAPHDPGAPSHSRYLAVRKVLGGAWGIVDRRSGRLIEGAHPGERSYAAWAEAQSAARTLNDQPPR